MVINYYSFFLILLMVFTVAACNGKSNDAQILSICSILGDEARLYGRANYLRLFYTINPDKFEATYQKVADFDNVQHRAVINTYSDALKRLKAKDELGQRLIEATQEITQFVKHFIDIDYPVALSQKHLSKRNPNSDEFFIEINNIVKFDKNMQGFDKSKASFKGLLDKYNIALDHYKNKIGYLDE